MATIIFESLACGLLFFSCFCTGCQIGLCNKGRKYISSDEERKEYSPTPQEETHEEPQNENSSFMRRRLVPEEQNRSGYSSLIDLYNEKSGEGTYGSDYNSPPVSERLSSSNKSMLPITPLKKDLPDKDDFDIEQLSGKDCSICLLPFKEGENVSILSCFHCYHDACYSKWSIQSSKNQRSAICPLCGLKTKITFHAKLT